MVTPPQQPRNKAAQPSTPPLPKSPTAAPRAPPQAPTPPAPKSAQNKQNTQTSKQSQAQAPQVPRQAQTPQVPRQKPVSQVPKQPQTPPTQVPRQKPVSQVPKQAQTPAQIPRQSPASKAHEIAQKQKQQTQQKAPLAKQDAQLIPDIPTETAQRAQMGISGLDEMLSGGLIRGSVTSIIGQYGTGKTSFAIHFALEGLVKGESVLYIALEERRSRLMQYMNSYGIDIQKYIKNRRLLMINLDPSDFSLAIQGVKNEIPVLIKKTQADRLIIDPISLFEDLFDDDATRRRELMRFLETLRDLTNCSYLFTSETDKTNTFSSRYNLIEYLSDTVILLRYVRNSGGSEVHLAVEVVKMRMSSHFRETKPYELKKGMIEVYTDANVF